MRVLVVLMLLTLVLSSFCSLTFDSFTFWWSQLVALSFAFGGLVHCNWWPCPLQLVALSIAIGGLVHRNWWPCPSQLVVSIVAIGGLVHCNWWPQWSQLVALSIALGGLVPLWPFYSHPLMIGSRHITCCVSSLGLGVWG